MMRATWRHEENTKRKQVSFHGWIEQHWIGWGIYKKNGGLVFLVKKKKEEITIYVISYLLEYNDILIHFYRSKT